MSRKPIYSAPDPFSISPLLALLPVKGNVGALTALTPSFYARYERVVGLQKEFEGEEHKTMQKKLHAEHEMLRQILDWLKVKPV